MARISQQTKDGLIVVTTIGVGLATGFFVDEWTKHEKFVIALVCLIFLGVLQLVLVFVPSQDMADLEEYRKNETVALRMKNAYAAQALKQAEAGNLSESLKWQDVWAKRESEGKSSGQ